MEQIPGPERHNEEFARRRKQQYMLFAATVALGVCVMILSNNEAEFTLVSLALIVGSTVVHHRTWRCPACAKFLGKNLNPSSCPACGAQVR